MFSPILHDIYDMLVYFAWQYFASTVCVCIFVYKNIFFFFFQDLRIILIFANVFYNYDDKH